MENFGIIVAAVLFPVIFATAAWWLWTCYRLFSHAKKNDPALYQALGYPDLIRNNKLEHTTQLFSLLYGDLGERFHDPLIERFRRQMRAVGVLYAILFVGLVGAAIVGVAYSS